ncbi:MAG TPA: hypothetical protein VNN79_05110 [Actinomycetota bacterium]|nr:hypothetical protein [Actinomycetota bacterium]
MFELEDIARHRSRTLRFVGAALVVLMAPTLFWIGRSSAGPAVQGRAGKATKSAANVPTGKTNVVSISGDIPCTVSPNYADMPGMAVTFKLGGTASRPVIVMLQAQWFMPTEGVTVRIRFLVDGVVQSGPTDVLVVERPTGVALTDGAHGFDFLSDPLTPGTHTAKIQWKDNGVGQGCVANRTLLVMHK